MTSSSSSSAEWYFKVEFLSNFHLRLLSDSSFITAEQALRVQKTTARNFKARILAVLFSRHHRLARALPLRFKWNRTFPLAHFLYFHFYYIIRRAIYHQLPRKWYSNGIRSIKKTDVSGVKIESESLLEINRRGKCSLLYLIANFQSLITNWCMQLRVFISHLLSPQIGIHYK